MSDGAAGTKSRDDVDHLGQLLVGGACHYGCLRCTSMQ